MKRILKRLLTGLLIWAVPFFTSFLVWDAEANAPSIDYVWFSSLMAVTWAIGFAIAAYLYFKDVKKDTVKDGVITGVTWYVQLILLDLIVLVGAFSMEMSSYYPMLLTYLNAIPISVAIGYLRK